MKKLELTPRLQRLADWVPPGARIVDVGTDHAYLPVWLWLHGRVVSAIACDLRAGPLERAKETGRVYGGSGVSFRLGNGLDSVSPEEVDTIIIAGMGGENISAILERAPWTAKGRYTLLLQPQSRAEVLRRFLMEHKYAIRREALVEDRGTIYPVMEAGPGEMRLSLGQIYGGAALLHDPLEDQYIIEKIVRLSIAIAGTNRAGQGSCSAHLSSGVENGAQQQKTVQKKNGDGLREILTALLSLREEWRRAKSTGN